MPLISLLYAIHKKNEILFNIILNNHMKEEKHPKLLLQIQQTCFMIINILKNTDLYKEALNQLVGFK